MHVEAEQQIKDTEHLKILSIVYYITGGITVLKSFVFLIHIFMGIVFLAIAPSGEKQVAIIGYLLLIIGCVAFVLCMLLGIIKLATGYYLSKRKMRIFCLVAGVITCLSIPFGTMQGVFTIIVLVRQSVIDQFDSVEPKNTTS